MKMDHSYDNISIIAKEKVKSELSALTGNVIMKQIDFLRGWVLFLSFFVMGCNGQKVIRDDAIEIETYTLDPAKSGIAKIHDGIKGVQVGDKSADFTLFDLDGAEVSLSDMAGRPVILNFWATWCAPCRAEMPHLEAAYQQYQQDNLAILALNQDELREEISPFRDELGLTFPLLLDDNAIVAATYGAFRLLPSTYFIAPDGTVIAIHRGTLTPDVLDSYIQELFAPLSSSVQNSVIVAK